MATTLTTEQLGLMLAGEFRAAVEAALGRALATNESAAPAGDGWATAVAASGIVGGQITVWVDEAGVNAIAKALMRLDEAPEPGIAAEMLTGLWAQAAAATVTKDDVDGLALVAGTATRGPLPADGTGLVFMDGETALASLLVTGTVAPTIASAATPATAAAAAGLAAPGAAGRSEYPGNLAALLDIDLPLVVRFARTEMSLRSLSQLGPGSMVDMGRSPDAPVQLLIGGQIIAEGEVVVVEGNYGVRITSLVSPAERLKAMDL